MDTNVRRAEKKDRKGKEKEIRRLKEENDRN
jgi:hypothetical protein